MMIAAQSHPHQQEQPERKHQADDKRGGYDSLASGSQCTLVLQCAKPALEAAEWTSGPLPLLPGTGRPA